MKNNLFLAVLALGAIGLGGCGGKEVSDDPSGVSTGAISNDDIKKSAKKAITNAINLDSKKKFDKVAVKDASSKVCNEVLVSIDVDDVIKHAKDLRKLVVRAVGGDVGEMQKALKKLCSSAVTGLGGECQLDKSQIEVHAFGKNDCDADKIYVGIVGQTHAAEDAIGEHHHFDEWKNGALRLDGQDESEDDLFSGDDGDVPIPIVGD